MWGLLVALLGGSWLLGGSSASSTTSPTTPRADAFSRAKGAGCKADALRNALAKQIGVVTPPAAWDRMSCDEKLSWIYGAWAGAPGFVAIAHAVLSDHEFGRLFNQASSAVEGVTRIFRF